MLKKRLDKAYELLVRYPDIPVVVTGGQGDDEIISESQAMTNYLISQGIDRERILMEDKSVNTLENMKFSREKILETGRDGKVAYSTTNYHVFRSYVYAHDAGMNAEGIAAPTKRYFWPNAFLREFVGLLVAEWRLLIPALLALILFFGVLAFTTI
jgi:uncharacterized SAM-binding protein YcdF (DUF218 family)